jgi:glutamate formiminotransferase/glutamate formiminotransferase/formiminotetrahydrofolate cyclodeaminase
MSASLPLLAVPNVSEGREAATIDAIGEAFRSEHGARLLDVHSDVDHNRSVFTLAGDPGSLSTALLEGASIAVQRIDLSERHDPTQRGQHPHVGAVDVVPLVYLDPDQRGQACAQALVIADELGERLGVPVFLYGELADGRTRAQLRRGGVSALAQRIEAGELYPDFGPARLHPTAGATLLAAREPLVAFNLELAPPATLVDARRIASLIREGASEGLPGVRAIGVSLRGGSVAQVSMNIERPLQTPLAAVVQAVRRHAVPACGELVGLAPAGALEGLPEDLPLRGFDRARHVIENALGF